MNQIITLTVVGTAPTDRAIRRNDSPGQDAWNLMRIAAGSSIVTHIVVLVVAQFGLPGTCTKVEVAEHYLPVELVTSQDIAAFLPPEPLIVPSKPPQEPSLVDVPDPPAEVPEPGVVDAPPNPVEPPDEREPFVDADPQPPLDPGEDVPDIVDHPMATDADVLALLGVTAQDDVNLTVDPSIIARTQLTPEELREIEALKQAIIAQVSRCWNPPVGARGAIKLLVDVQVSFKISGEVQTLSIEDTGRMQRDPYFRAAADAARNAFLNPACNPLTLPADKYGLWNEIIFTFNPSEMSN